MTNAGIKVSKGLEFLVMALPGVGGMTAKGEDKQEAARVSCVTASKATHWFVIWVDIHMDREFSGSL